jgi:hypothetical protein
LVTRVKSNSVAWFPAAPPPANRPKPKGRPQKYGKKIKVAWLLKNADRLQEAPSPVYGEKDVKIRFRVADLLWRPIGILVRFVAVDHPRRGTILLMSTDWSLEALDIIRIYGLRFKIEVSFKQALRVIGAYAYHFWMAAMCLLAITGRAYGGRVPRQNRSPRADPPGFGLMLEVVGAGLGSSGRGTDAARTAVAGAPAHRGYNASLRSIVGPVLAPLRSKQDVG